MEKGWKPLVRPLGGHPKRGKACLFTSLFFFLMPEQKVLNLGLQQLKKKKINATFWGQPMKEGRWFRTNNEPSPAVNCQCFPFIPALTHSRSGWVYPLWWNLIPNNIRTLKSHKVTRKPFQKIFGHEKSGLKVDILWLTWTQCLSWLLFLYISMREGNRKIYSSCGEKRVSLESPSVWEKNSC